MTDEDDRRSARHACASRRLLDGYRGQGPAPIARRIVRRRAWPCRTTRSQTPPPLIEVEINPLICHAHGAVAADALIRLRETTGDDMTDSHRSRPSARGPRARSHARPAQGQCHRSRDQPDHGRGLHRVPRRPRPARGARDGRRREVLLPRLGPEGGGGWRRGRRRLRRRRLRRVAGTARAEQAGDRAPSTASAAAAGWNWRCRATSSWPPTTPPSRCRKSGPAPWPTPPRSSCPSASPITSRWRCC